MTMIIVSCLESVKLFIVRFRGFHFIQQYSSVVLRYFTSASMLGNTREIRDKFNFCAIHFLWERKSAMVYTIIV